MTIAVAKNSTTFYLDDRPIGKINLALRHIYTNYPQMSANRQFLTFRLLREIAEKLRNTAGADAAGSKAFRSTWASEQPLGHTAFAR
ncbi:MAG TPA: hypothetical protein VFQ90_05275 [Stellaceae bacterium]|jgi:hypothetical protein|nr:hypothetical protein [Stellaceae bacterium]